MIDPKLAVGSDVHDWLTARECEECCGSGRDYREHDNRCRFCGGTGYVEDWHADEDER